LRQLKIINILFVTIALSACISNTIIDEQSKDNYFNVINTPIYVFKAANITQEVFEDELSSCISSSKDKVNISTKVGTGTGAIILANGLYGVATATGFLAPIIVVGGSVLALVGGGTIWATQATGENRKYLNIENCLEKRGHDVIFYNEKSSK
jgi:hypothetical protein|tara:strand:+ start:657 stop:1115 length:459 start_codon:yes stop_codon:yes gene_type:complete